MLKIVHAGHLTCDPQTAMSPSESKLPRGSMLTIAYPRGHHSAGSGASNFSRSLVQLRGIPARKGTLSRLWKPGHVSARRPYDMYTNEPFPSFPYGLHAMIAGTGSSFEDGGRKTSV